VALWDLRGKATRQPVWRLLGGSGPRVACYASGHLWRHYTLDELEHHAGELAALGFRAMKLRCGAERSDAAEVERLAVVRGTVGADVDVMVDINQGWGVDRAIRVGRRFAEHDLSRMRSAFDGRTRIVTSVWRCGEATPVPGRRRRVGTECSAVEQARIATEDASEAQPLHARHQTESFPRVPVDPAVTP
jgi:hypothetical protein